MSEEKKFLVVFLCAASIVLGIFLMKNRNVSECYVYKENGELVEVPTQQECQFFYDELTGHSFEDSEDRYYSLSSIDYYTTNSKYFSDSVYWTVHADFEKLEFYNENRDGVTITFNMPLEDVEKLVDELYSELRN